MLVSRFYNSCVVLLQRSIQDIKGLSEEWGYFDNAPKTEISSFLLWFDKYYLQCTQNLLRVNELEIWKYPWGAPS
jgi:hypothetical protein